jgi:hypothetical protein
MSKMGWIAQLIQDNSYQQFRDSYETALKDKEYTFIFEGRNCDVVFAKHVCTYVEDYMLNSNEHYKKIQQDLSNEYEDLITKGF